MSSSGGGLLEKLYGGNLAWPWTKLERCSNQWALEGGSTQPLLFLSPAPRAKLIKLSRGLANRQFQSIRVRVVSSDSRGGTLETRTGTCVVLCECVCAGVT